MRFSLLFSFLLLACSNPDNPVDSGVPAAKVAVGDCNGDGQVDLTDALLGCSDGVEVPPAGEAPPTEEVPPTEEAPPAEESPPAGEVPPTEEVPPAEEMPPTEEPDGTAQAMEGDCNGDGQVDLTDVLIGCSDGPSVTAPDSLTEESAPTETLGTPEGDRAVLEILFSTTGGNQWRVRDGWLSDEPLYAWAEVRTDHNGRVTGLYLSANGLRGPIPPELGQLTELRDLRLSNNWLSGSIPPELGQLTNLELLYLSGNQLRGPIPPELGQLTRLREFLFYRNSFSGCLPPALLNVPRLEPRNLPVCRYIDNYDRTPAEGDRAVLEALFSATGGNQWRIRDGWLSDEPLSAWEGVSTDANGRVIGLYLHGNGLSGSIPPALGQLTNLRDLWLHDNQLSGSIPPELGQLTNLRRLYLSGNQLSGFIPSALGQLTILKEFLFYGNRLSGCIPRALLNVPRLEPKDLPVCR